MKTIVLLAVLTLSTTSFAGFAGTKASPARCPAPESTIESELNVDSGSFETKLTIGGKVAEGLFNGLTQDGEGYDAIGGEVAVKLGKNLYCNRLSPSKPANAKPVFTCEITVANSATGEIKSR